MHGRTIPASEQAIERAQSAHGNPDQWALEHGIITADEATRAVYGDGGR